MKVFVVTCEMDGCEECGNTYHVVGVFEKEEEANATALLHEQGKIGRKHLHPCMTNVEPHEVNVMPALPPAIEIIDATKASLT